MIEIYYHADFRVGEFEVSERQFCINLLREQGYTCVAGSVGSDNATVGELDKDARADAISITDDRDRTHFITGPNPIINTGVGIWATA